MTRQQLLDRFETHTRTCSSCRAAHSTAKTLAAAAQTLALVLLVAATALGVQRGPTFLPLALAAGAVAAKLSERGLTRLIASFVFVDYDDGHPSKN
jgi:pheophorbide a oxygenase